jgi:hypothetical protein
MPQPVVIRISVLVRAYVTVFAAVWCGFLIAVTVAAGLSLIPIVMLVFGATLCYRNFQLAAVADESGLVVHNRFSSRRVSWPEIEDFRVSGGRGLSNSTIQVLLSNGEMFGLDVTTTSAIRPRSRARLDTNVSGLRAWLQS